MTPASAGSSGDGSPRSRRTRFQVAVTISHEGYVKRLSLTEYRTQGRGGKGVRGADTKEGDFVERMMVTTNHQYLLVLTQTGQMHWLRVFDIPEGGRYSFSGDEPSDLKGAMDLMSEMQELDQLISQVQEAERGGDLGRIDRDLLEDLMGEDAADDLLFNEVIWRSVRGPHSPMPAPVRAAFVVPRLEKDDDD